MRGLASANISLIVKLCTTRKKAVQSCVKPAMLTRSAPFTHGIGALIAKRPGARRIAVLRRYRR